MTERAPSRPSSLSATSATRRHLCSRLRRWSCKGYSTRKVKKITDGLCGLRFSRQTVSRLAQKLNGQERPGPNGSWSALIPFSLSIRCSEGAAASGRAVHHADDCRGYQRGGLPGDSRTQDGFSKTGEGWRALSSHLKARGLSGADMLTSDAHDGTQQSFPGAIGQRCPTEEFLGLHFRRNVADRVTALSQEQVHAMLDSILEAPSQRMPGGAGTRNDQNSGDGSRCPCDALGRLLEPGRRLGTP